MKILHCPFNIGNQASVLSRAENEIASEKGGESESVSVNFVPNFGFYPADRTYSMLFFYQKGRLGKVVNAFKIMVFGIFNFARHDVFHFYFGRTFLGFGVRFDFFNHLDLRILKRLGKRVFMTYQGCDARMRIQSAKNDVSACKKDECSHGWCSEKSDRMRRTNISRVTALADKVFCLNPDLLAFVPGSEFVPYSPIFPEDAEKFQRRSRAGGHLRILHAPSDRAIKGTKYVEEAVMKLKERHDFDFVLMENMSQEKVFEEYRNSDIFIDQLLVGWYGGAAVEAMAFGLPVMSFVNEEFLKRIPHEMARELPIISACPAEIGEKLEDLILNPDLRLEKAAMGLNFVRKWHDPRRIAECMLALYEDPKRSFWEVWGQRNV